MKQKLLLKTMLLLFALIAGSSSVWAQTTIWSEDFTGATADQAITTPTNTTYSGVTYTCTNGTGTSPGNTVVKNENTGGGTAPELMVGKKGSGDGATGGKFTVVIPLDNYEGDLILTYYQNKYTLKVSSPTAGVSGGQTLKPSEVGQQTTKFTGITASMTSITIEFEATTTSNVRLDDIVLTTAPAYTWDLSTDSYDVSPTEELISWTSTYATMKNERNGKSNTAVNNYIPTTRTSTRFYGNNILTITPTSGYTITSIVFTATTTGYADALQGSAWTNATASKDDKTVTVTPTDGSSAISATIGGTCGFTAVKVCYGPSTVSKTITAAGWATYCSPYALDFSSTIANLDGAYIVTGNTGTTLNLSPAITTTVPANTGLLLKGSGEVTIPVAASGAYVTTGNKLHGVTVATEKDPETIYVLMNEAAGVGFYKNSNAFTVGANTAYLAVGELEGFEGGSSAPRFMAIGDDNNGTTGIETLNVERGTLNDNSYYNLNGQRVAQPTKGLYIVNGRKVVIK